MKQDKTELRYLELLARNYPTIQEASTEIINLQAIMELPKGTEHFMSDLHGESEAFIHIMNNASGEIRQKVDKIYANILTSTERAQLSTLIYYPEEKLKEIKELDLPDMDEWYKITLHRLIDICRLVASKYSRKKVRNSLPEGYSFIINELINADISTRKEYFERIIATIVEIDNADEFIIALSSVIKHLVVDKMHIVGDIFDRGLRPDVIFDILHNYHSVDIQWGNHDALWMGAACGSMACIACVLSNSIKYGNFESLETAYGLNLRPLAILAQEKYHISKRFTLKNTEENFRAKDLELMSKMYEAISIIQFKLEGQIIHRHPEYKMDDRALLDKINYEKSTICINGKDYSLDLSDLPAFDKDDPYKLTADEQNVMNQLVLSFSNSYKLQKDVRFLYSTGSMYLLMNDNLMFHGCVPLNDDGSFMTYKSDGIEVSGREYFDYADKLARQAYYGEEDSEEKKKGMDFLWFLWCGRHSPLFGRERITTFERLFIADKETWKEADNAYYKLINNPKVCDRIFTEFSLDQKCGHIINGHVPVHAHDGESPIKAGGRAIVIDGGFCKALHKKTGIAGYTLIYDSYGMRISAHEPFAGIDNAIRNNSDILSQEMVFDLADHRLTVGETDDGAYIRTRIAGLKELLIAYRLGTIKERCRQNTTTVKD